MEMIQREKVLYNSRKLFNSFSPPTNKGLSEIATISHLFCAEFVLITTQRLNLH